MIRDKLALLLAALVVGGCGASHESSGSDPGLGPGEPEWSGCFVEGEYETCAEVCEAQGTQCAAEACPADPEFCKPNDCDMATSMIGQGAGICSDPTAGGYVAAACDDPIEFILTDTARCCCES